MKAAKLLRTTLFFFLLLLLPFFTTNPPLLASAKEFASQEVEEADVVYATDGESVFSSDKYYMVSAITGAGGGGVKPGSFEDEDYKHCPVTVVQEYSDLRFGMPVKFSFPGNSDAPENFVYTNVPLKIEFTKKLKCAESSEWVMVKGKEEAWVGIGGVVDHADEKLLNGTFRIQKSEPFYKIVFCTDSAPQDLHSKPRRRHCSNIGVETYIDDTRRLVMDAFRPFEVVFINARFDHAKSFKYIKQVVAHGN